MAPVDPDLAEFLERSSARSVDAVGRLEEELAGVRRALDDSRRAQDADRELEADRFKRLHARIDELTRTIDEVDKRCGALVLEEEGADGETVVRARPTRVGLDAKTIIGLVTVLFTALASSPVLIELLK